MQSSYDHYKLSQDMMQAWANFARSGNPGRINEVVQWEEAFDKERKVLQSQVMVLDPINYRMEKEFFKEKCDVFWKPKIFL